MILYRAGSGVGRGQRSLARDGEVEVACSPLLGEQDDLTGVHLDVPDDPEDGLKDGGVPPCATGLRVDHREETLGRKRGDDADGFMEGEVEALAGFGRRDGEIEGELFVAPTDVRLLTDAVEDPLAKIAFEVQEQVGDGVFVVAATLKDLLVGEPGETACDGRLQMFELRGGVGEKVVGDGVGGHAVILRCDGHGRRVF